MKLNHQRIRVLMQLIFTPILLIPEIAIMLSPLLVLFLPVFRHFAEIFAYAVVILWIAITFVAIFLGRVYCSHVCPITGLFTFVSYITRNRSILSMEYPKLLGRIMLFFWMAAPIYVLLRNLGNLTGILPKEEIYSSLIINLYYFFFAISGILTNTYGKISVRHYTCPFAAFMISANRLGRRLMLPSLKYTYDKAACKSCGKCSKKCMVNRDIPQLLHKEVLNFEECVQCNYCVENCRYSAIRHTWKEVT